MEAEKRNGGAGRQRAFTDDVLRAIPGWIRAGADSRDIAEVLGTTVESLGVTCARVGISLRPQAYLDVTDIALQHGISQKIWKVLRAEAVRRHVPPAKLVADIVEIVASDDMFAAVLGDVRKGS